MASNACKFICLIIFLSFVAQGYGESCHLNDLSVKQSKTGKLVKNKPEWEVRVRNPCKCKFYNTELSCAGFQSVIPVAPSLLSKSRDLCLINPGKFIFPNVDFVFTYVWETSFDLKVVDAIIDCP